jgi:putative sterol carrier protein
MDLAQVTEGMRQKVGEDAGIGATIKFDFGDDGVIYLDGASTPNTVSNDDKEADCTVRISLENFLKLVEGDLNPTMAFMMGKLKVDGDMGLAMKLSKLLG